jgi:hypothetical protein
MGHMSECGCEARTGHIDMGDSYYSYINTDNCKYPKLIAKLEAWRNRELKFIKDESEEGVTYNTDDIIVAKNLVGILNKILEET